MTFLTNFIANLLAANAPAPRPDAIDYTSPLTLTIRPTNR